MSKGFDWMRDYANSHQTWGWNSTMDPFKQYVCLFDFQHLTKDTIYYCSLSLDSKEIYAYETEDIKSFVGIYKTEYFITLSKFRQDRINEILDEG